jgi:hypothetical protein
MEDFADTYNITPDVMHKLGHYVYAYIDPRNESVFYIGKGAGDRGTDHLFATGETEKIARIKSIRESGMEPRIDIIAHGLRDNDEAIRVEAALIELVGVKNLTNKIGGLRSVEFPRRPLKDFIIEMAPQQADIIDPSLLIRINKFFRYGMSEKELYEATRGIWVIGKRREKAEYAMAVYAGVIRQVYKIESWHSAGSTPYSTRNDIMNRTKSGGTRWEFVGQVAPKSVHERYYGRSVAHLFKPGQQSPVVGIRLA